MTRHPIPRERVRVECRHGNSRFIATAAPAASVEEARAFIRAIREEMPDATHHVYAMKIGYGQSVTEGMSDDGEPSGTSGPPVLAVLRGAPVGDIVLVVTRYFGGTKLGTGGLVTAYSSAAKLCLENLRTIEKVARAPVRVTCPYHLYERIKGILEEGGALIGTEEFAEEVRLAAAVPVDRLEDLSAHLRDLSGGRVLLEPGT